MTNSQITAMQEFTTKVDVANRFISLPGTLEGDINWRREPASRGAQMLIGSNIEGRDWFNKNILVIAFVGPRGGIKISHCEGIDINRIRKH